MTQKQGSGKMRFAWPLIPDLGYCTGRIFVSHYMRILQYTILHTPHEDWDKWVGVCKYPRIQEIKLMQTAIVLSLPFTKGQFQWFLTSPLFQFSIDIEIIKVNLVLSFLF